MAWVLHMALKWHVVGMIPSMLIAPLIAQYTQSTWASFTVHAIGNAPLWIILLVGILNTKETPRQNHTTFPSTYLKHKYSGHSV